MPILNIAWWNLENLFDAATATRPPELAAVLKNELKGWEDDVRLIAAGSSVNGNGMNNNNGSSR